MTDKPATEVVSAAPAPAKKQAAAKKTTAPRAKPSHPPTSEMVLNAIKSLKERNGSSLQAIKKYIATTYKVDVEKQSPFIRKYLKQAVEQTVLIQTKGKGASGSFKVNNSKTESKAKPKVAKVKKEAKKAPAVAKKAKTVTTSAKKTVKKATTAAKKPAAKKPTATKKTAPTEKAAAKKSVVKKTAKSPAKPKAPKPKKTAATATKKTTASKKK